MIPAADGSRLEPDDTPIVATSTASGNGARALIRASGRDVVRGLADRVSGEASSMFAEIRRGCRRGFWRMDDGSGLPVIVFVAIPPASFTGECMVEFEIPGNPELAEQVASEVRDHLEHTLGTARLAGPGEFSSRAFLNGRISISDAASIAASIAADRDVDLESVERIRGSRGGRALAALSGDLLAVVARLEAAIDFTDEEDVIGCTVGEIRSALEPIHSQLAELLEASEAVGDSTRRSPRVTLAGRPNAGKSTLFNALIGTDRVVTSPVAGTTRDVIETEIAMPCHGSSGGERVMVRLSDTAGIENSSGAVTDPDQAASVASREAMAAADLVLACRIPSDPPFGATAGRQAIDVVTKFDLGGSIERSPTTVTTSSLTGQGLDRLRFLIGEWATGRHRGSDAVVGWRSLAGTALERTDEAIRDLADQETTDAPWQPETTAAACRLAAEAVGRLEGDFDPDAVLDLVFGRFCIGK